MTQTFPLRSARPWRWILRPLGVRPGSAQVELTEDGRLVATFGRLAVETPLTNVCGYRVTGPYRWWRAIGPRGSLADRGFTFGTSAHGGVCLCFREWVASGYVRGGSMETLTVTVDDLEALAGALDERGISGSVEGGGDAGGAAVPIMQGWEAKQPMDVRAVRERRVERPRTRSTR